MTRPLAIAVALAMLGATAVHAAPQAAPKSPRRAPPPPPPRPAPPLPSLPSVPRVRVEVSREHVVVVQEVNLPRGEWKGGDLDLYVAFGAPGAPEAFDARLVAVPDGDVEPADADAGDAVAIDRAPYRPVSAQPLLGPPQMAGAILHVGEAAFRRATAAGGMAALRIRSLLPLPVEDARTGRELLIRLGAALGTPLTLGRLQIANVARAEANLCGSEADPWPLAIAITPRPITGPSASSPIAPVLAVRHASDDLCIRFWL